MLEPSRELRDLPLQLSVGEGGTVMIDDATERLAIVAASRGVHLVDEPNLGIQSVLLIESSPRRRRLHPRQGSVASKLALLRRNSIFGQALPGELASALAPRGRSLPFARRGDIGRFGIYRGSRRARR